MFIAHSLIQGVLINAPLTRSLLKMILHQQIEVSDVEDADKSLYNSMMYIKNNKIDDDSNYEQYFEVDTIYGETVELKPNGSTIKVTNENKNEYINLLAQYRLKTSVGSQIYALCQGFDSLINHKDIRIFTPNELSLLIWGVHDIDVDDLIRNICFIPPYNEKTPVIKMFFEIIRS